MYMPQWIKQALTGATRRGLPALRTLAPISIIALTLVVAACGPVATAPGAPSATPSATSMPGKSPTATPSTSYPIQVYFSRHPDSDSNPLNVFPVRRVSPTLGVATYAVQQFIAGPSASEKAAGYYNELALSGPSSCGGADFKLTLDARGAAPEKATATVQFCRASQLPGDMSGPRVIQALTTTLRQFPSIQRVVILDSTGACFADLSGRNLCVQGYAVKVYFSKHPDSDTTPRLTFPVNRLSPDLGVATFAMQQLVAGPTATESQRGYFTPLAGAFSGPSVFGNDMFSIKLDTNVAKPETGTVTLQFGQAMRGLGDTGAILATNEITATLTQFPNIQRVVILNRDGSYFDNLHG